MKKIAVLGAMIFIISPKIFADENRSEVQNLLFTWQLYNYYRNSSSNNFLLMHPFENNAVNINYHYNRNFLYSEDFSFYNYIYSVDEPLGYYIFSTHLIFKFIDGISGGPERRRREQTESNRRYNILNPSEPPRKANF